MYFLRFAYSNLFYFFIQIYILLLFYRLKFYKTPVYRYSLAQFFYENKFAKKDFSKKIFFIIRSFILFGLIFLIARPQWVDSRSKVNINGVDIIIALDMSGSMQLFDDLKDRRSRVEVAKTEAINFIEKRDDDAIGIVIFAADAISLCPLTLDKNILKETIEGLELGYVNPGGTALGTGLATAVNKLKSSKAKSKVVILLTDGVPTTEKVGADLALELAKHFEIRVYTIAIGNEKGGFFLAPFVGLQRAENSVDTNLLKRIADSTGGQFYRADSPKQLREIYNKIDKLERTQYQTNIFNNYYEAFLTFIWYILLLLLLELLLKLFIWPTFLS